MIILIMEKLTVPNYPIADWTILKKLYSNFIEICFLCRNIACNGVLSNVLNFIRTQNIGGVFQNQVLGITIPLSFLVALRKQAHNLTGVGRSIFLSAGFFILNLNLFIQCSIRRMPQCDRNQCTQKNIEHINGIVCIFLKRPSRFHRILWSKTHTD